MFYIQACNPKLEIKINIDDKCLSDAIESIFPLNTENAILMWNHICVPLSYKYDISYMMEDIIKLLNHILRYKNGHLNINWLPDTFRCNWEVNWNSGYLNIKSYWECTTGHLENILNNNKCISLCVKDFLCEWKKIIDVVISGLIKSGYKVNQIRGMQELFELHNKIDA